MKATYAGITVDLGELVYVIDTGPARPVFHRNDGGATACGTLASVRIGLPARHVRRFARPCRRCWPELNRATLELLAGPLR